MCTKSVNNFQFGKVRGHKFSSAFIMCKGEIIIATEYVTLCAPCRCLSKDPLAFLELLLQILPTLCGTQIKVRFALSAEWVIEFLQISTLKIIRKCDFRRDPMQW